MNAKNADRDQVKRQVRAEADERTEKLANTAALLANEAAAAAQDGDLEMAAAKYMEAGDFMLEAVPLQVKAGERDFTRILAVANFYKGGHYAKADAVLKKVKPLRLKQEFRDVYYRFRKELTYRAHKNYAERVRKQLNILLGESKNEAALAYIEQHSYALPTMETVTIKLKLAAILGLITVDELEETSNN